MVRPEAGPQVSLERLDDTTRALVAFAGAVATGQEALIEARGKDCAAAGVPPLWMDELLLQSVLICGWPRALTAARIWRQGGTPPATKGREDGTDYRRAAEWEARGEVVCRAIYGSTYPALRRNIHGLHPDLEAGMIVEGYGRILGRPGLDLARRELGVVAQIAVLGARRQLRSHLQGALNAGAAPAMVRETLEVVRSLVPKDEWAAVLTLWDRVRG